jgi:hypothetical protein
MTAKFLELNEKYKAYDYFNTKIDCNFLEFTLEELGMPSAEELLKSTMSIVDDIGGIRGWHKNNKESTSYKGFSICTNPDGDEHLQSTHATLGHPELNWSFSRANNPNPPWKDDKNTYYDTYGFTNVHPSAKKHYKDFLKSVDLMPTRSRVMWASPGFTQSWHVDETIFAAVRFNIPLTTEDCWVLELDGDDGFGNKLKMQKHLEIGKVYMWNTKIQHRILDLGGATKPRISIVAAFIPWFEKTGSDWKPNKYFGVQPIDMVNSKMIFPYAL